MTSSNITTVVWALMAILGLIWGASFLAVRVALDEVPPLTSVAHRTVWAALVLWGVVLFRGIAVPRSAGLWAAFAVMGVLNNVVPFTLMAWGQLHIETGLTAILNAATAIWGVLIAALVFSDERLTLRRATGVGLGFLGVATAIGLGRLLTLDLRSLAQLAVIGGTLSYAVAGAFARAKLGGVTPLMAATGMLTCSAALMLPLAWIFDGPIRFDLQPRTWGAIGYYAVIATAVAYLFYYAILKRAGSGNLLLVTLLVAPVAIILGAVVRGEALTPQAYAGFALLALGLLILDGRLLRRSRAATASAPD